MIGGSAGRQINRIRTKYRSVSIYIIYFYAMYVYSECEVDLYLTPDLSICRPADLPTSLSYFLSFSISIFNRRPVYQSIYKQDDRLVGRSADKQDSDLI